MIYNFSHNPQLQNLMLFHNSTFNSMFAFLIVISAFVHSFSISIMIYCRIIFLKLFVAGHLSWFVLCFASLPLVTWQDTVDAFVFFHFVTVILMSMMVCIKLIVELHCFWGELFPILCNIKIIQIVIYCYHYVAMTLAVLHHTKCVLFHFDFFMNLSL